MLNSRDLAILDVLQRDSDTPLADVGAKVHLSPSACSRRIAHLREAGYIRRNVAVIDRAKVGLPTTVFVTVSVRTHSAAWTEQFRQAVAGIPEIMEVYRLTGNIDYLLRIVLPSVDDYDRVYKALVSRIEMNVVCASIVMETVKSAESLPLHHGAAS
ncbi:Lrp/AsnC family transcriptional regulator [Novosphingobium capsulatum]|uniref:Lrp/AsnC family transcriptional regulator n=1 Tax=Novosphingobium capsulatum TaxID=13688 RepID=UPI0007883FC3|nr:Lrp/AsnC family transcriptional regulator [Novosphingobium capsulatum]WQD91612.1 Lrp/AsnC family transcriptional regulator [Novosphingobium capsulatum]